MPDASDPMLMILSCTTVALLVLLIGLVWRMMGRLARIEAREERSASKDGLEKAVNPVESSAGGAFEAFLEEDPGRRSLAKKDQFAAYREWRKEKGLNWSNS